jgi:hypothetical protein
MLNILGKYKMKKLCYKNFPDMKAFSCVFAMNFHLSSLKAFQIFEFPLHIQSNFLLFFLANFRAFFIAYFSFLSFVAQMIYVCWTFSSKIRIESNSSVKFPAKVETDTMLEDDKVGELSSRPVSKHYRNWNPKFIDALGEVSANILLRRFCFNVFFFEGGKFYKLSKNNSTGSFFIGQQLMVN